MKTVDVLIAAREILASGKWGKGRFFEPLTGYYCAAGALHRACGAKVWGGNFSSPNPKLTCRAFAYLGFAARDFGDIMCFNDRIDTTIDHVLKLYDIAIANARRRHSFTGRKLTIKDLSA